MRLMACVLAMTLSPGLASAQVVIFQGSPDGLQFPPRGLGPPARDGQQKTGTARIRGRVFMSDSGQPLRKAQVRAFAPELRENRQTTTDVDGKYEFKDLPAGRYTISASKGSFVALSYGQLRPFEPGKPLEILDGQTVEKVDFTLPRGGVITGRILDEYGDPVADAQVAPMRYQYLQGRRRLIPSGRPAQTNDIGEYRLFGLPPGQYYLSATLRGGMMMMAESDDRSGYAPTYYPGTPNVAEAQRVTVGIGQTLNDLNMALMPVHTARISGTVVDSTGKPATSGMVMVFQGTSMGGFMNMGGQIRPDGTFVVNGVAPGEYTLNANVGMPMPGTVPDFATATVTVAGDDVTGVVLAASRFVTATGRVVVDADTAKSLRPSTLRLMAQPAGPEPMMGGPGGGGQVNDDFTFELRARPGLSFIRIFPMGSTTLALKRVHVNGVDVTDTGIDFKPNEDVSDVEIELTTQLTEVSGLVTNARSEPVKDYSVVVFAQDRDRWGFGSRYFGNGRPDQDGRFKVRALPAGDYYIVALESLEPGEASDPEFLEPILGRATKFSLSDGETKTLDLKLTTSTP